MAKRTFTPRSDPLETLRREGTFLRERLAPERERVVKASVAFSEGSVAHLRGLPQERQAAFVKGMVTVAQDVFQPWAMEILFVLGLLERARFTEIQRLLGVSSRTLSDKLQMLREHGYVEREVFDEQPVRIEYYLTRRGKRVAVLGSPLFCELDSVVYDGAAPAPAEAKAKVA